MKPNRPQKLNRLLCLAAILIITIPVLAAAVRARPQGPYNFTLVGSASYRGQTVSGRERGTLTMTGIRIRGQTNDNNTRFNLRLADRLNRNRVQTSTANGRVTVDLGQYGTYSAPVHATTRVQRTRSGSWKLNANYAVNINSGPADGLTLRGRVIAKSI